MLQDVNLKVNPGFPQQNQHSKVRRNSFLQQIWLKFKEETSKLLHLERSFVWCWNLDTSESRSEITGKFCNVVLEKDEEDYVDR